MKNISRYWKAVVAAIPLVVFLGNEAVQQVEVFGADGTLTGPDMWRIGMALFAIYGVYKVKNEPAHKPIVFDDSGHSDPVTVLAAVILAGILIVVILVVTGRL